MKDEFYSPVPKILASVLIGGSALCVLFSLLYQRAGQGWMLSCAITFGVIAYHIAIRFFVPVIVTMCFHKNYNYRNWWFRQKKWEPGFYRWIRVKKWKGKAFTYDPSEFSLKVHSLEEIIINMCHAELVHEWIVVLSFTSLFFAIPFGSFFVFLITVVFAALFDLTFVILQRFNRPRVVSLFERQRMSRR